MKAKDKREDYSDVKISKVNFIEGGLRGCKVEYEKVEKVGDREYRNTFNPTMKYPVHEELMKCMGWLKGHVLGICGYDREDMVLNQNLEVIGVTISGGGFVITAKLEVYENGKTINLVTPLTMNDEEYSQYEAVMKIVDAVHAETRIYLSKTVVMEDKQYVIKFFEKNKAEKEHMGFDKDTFLKLPEGEQVAFATELLKKRKMIVIHEEELEVPQFDGLNELKESAQPEVKKVEATMQVLEPEVIEEEITGEDIFKEDEEGDFSLNLSIAEPAKSTAKRKTA